MKTETWYVMEDGSCGDPREIAQGADGILRHTDGRAVAYAPHGPRSRSVDLDQLARDVASGKKSPTEARADLGLPPIGGKEMKPAQSATGYLTRDVAARDPFDHDRDGHPGGSDKPADSAGDDLAALRVQYHTAFGKRPFAGWDAATLREKIASKAE